MNNNVNNNVNNNDNNAAANDNGMISNNPSASNNNNDYPSELVGDNNNWMADNNPSQLNDDDHNPLADMDAAILNGRNNDDVEDAAAAADDDDTINNIYMVDGVEHRLPPGITMKQLEPFLVVDETTRELKAGPLNVFDYMLNMGLVIEPPRELFTDIDITRENVPPRHLGFDSAAEKVIMNPALRKCE
jgi:hypothetical protein